MPKLIQKKKYMLLYDFLIGPRWEKNKRKSTPFCVIDLKKVLRYLPIKEIPLVLKSIHHADFLADIVQLGISHLDQ